MFTDTVHYKTENDEFTTMNNTWLTAEYPCKIDNITDKIQNKTCHTAALKT